MKLSQFWCGLENSCEHDCINDCPYSENLCKVCCVCDFRECEICGDNPKNKEKHCEFCIITDSDELVEMIDFANWIIEKRKKEQQGS